MRDLLTKIRSAGHWRVAFRPTDFREDRLDIGSLERLVLSKQVQIRGWYFPHVSSRAPIVNGIDWIGQESESRYGKSYLEVWRLYTSGQFAWVRSFGQEWSLEPEEDRTLPVYEVVNVATEAYEFAARLALDDPTGERIQMRIVAGGLNNRRLVIGNPARMDIDANLMSVGEELQKTSVIEKADLIANPRARAVDDSLWLLQRLGWRSASRSVVRDIQEQVFGSPGD